MMPEKSVPPSPQALWSAYSCAAAAPSGVVAPEAEAASWASFRSFSIKEDAKPGFASALMWKDLKLAQEAATAAGASTPLGALAAQVYALHNAWGEGGTDFSGIIHLVRGRADQS